MATPNAGDADETVTFGKMAPVGKPDLHSGCSKKENKPVTPKGNNAYSKPVWDNTLYRPEIKMQSRLKKIPPAKIEILQGIDTSPHEEDDDWVNMDCPRMHSPAREQPKCSQRECVRERNCLDAPMPQPDPAYQRGRKRMGPEDYRYPQCPTNKPIIRTQCFRKGPNEAMQCYDDSNRALLDERNCRVFCHEIPKSSQLVTCCNHPNIDYNFTYDC